MFQPILALDKRCPGRPDIGLAPAFTDVLEQPGLAYPSINITRGDGSAGGK